MASICAVSVDNMVLCLFIYCCLHTFDIALLFYLISHTCINLTVFVCGGQHLGRCDHQPKRQWGISSRRCTELTCKLILLPSLVMTLFHDAKCDQHAWFSAVRAKGKEVWKLIWNQSSKKVQVWKHPDWMIGSFFSLHHLFIMSASHLQPKHYWVNNLELALPLSHHVGKSLSDMIWKLSPN